MKEVSLFYFFLTAFERHYITAQSRVFVMVFFFS